MGPSIRVRPVAINGAARGRERTVAGREAPGSAGKRRAGR
ncbi:hypothetical protein GZL_05020 [Streptomyces sp. 769]|nr:hypothetical protein GZL_05020 [Streptomyces sp. 769]